MRRWVALAVLVTGCGSSGDSNDGGSSDGSTGSAPTSTGPTSDASTGVADSTTSAAESSDGSSAGSSAGSSSGESDTGSTTGGTEYCGLDTMEGMTGPWFELTHMQMPVTDGMTLTLECGSQGLLMFWFATDQGGVTPDSDADVTYSVTLDVPGFDDLSPSGHFYQNLAYRLYVGCEEILGGPTGGFPVLLPDALTDVQQVDGHPATLHVALADGDQTATLDIDVTLAIPADLSPDTCFGAG